MATTFQESAQRDDESIVEISSGQPEIIEINTDEMSDPHATDDENNGDNGEKKKENKVSPSQFRDA
jgi:hypothetical protein